MATLPGRCVNDLYCTVASSGEIVHAPAEGRFVCSQCGRTLVPPNTPLRKRARGRNHGRDIGGTASVLLGLCGLCGGILLGALVFGDASARVVALSGREVILAPPKIVLALSQPEPITVGVRYQVRRHRRIVEERSTDTLAAAIAIAR